MAGAGLVDLSTPTLGKYYPCKRRDWGGDGGGELQQQKRKWEEMEAENEWDVKTGSENGSENWQKVRNGCENGE